MVDVLSDAWAEIRALKEEIRALKAANPLENASVTSGRLRFIGGELLIDSGGQLKIDGTLAVNGVTTVTGSFTVSGPWEMTGDGTITGDVTITGSVEFVGDVAVKGNLTVEDDGKIVAGDVEIRDGKVFIGGMELDPTSHSGYIKMPNGAEVLGSGSNLELYSGGTIKNGFKITPGGMAITTLTESLSTAGLKWLAWDPISGAVTFVEPSVGGPVGAFIWPFDPSTVSSEYGPRDTGFHEGIDFGLGVSEGDPIPAIGSGTVITSTYHSGWGRVRTKDELRERGAIVAEGFDKRSNYIGIEVRLWPLLLRSRTRM